MPAEAPRTQILIATAAGAALRVGSFVANLGFPHGDVHLDAATAESLANGRGFWTPWEEGSSLVADVIGATPAEFGHPADQHGPLWPMLGAPLVRLAGDGVLALQIFSLVAGIATIPVAARLFGRFSPRAGVLAAWACALALPLCDYSGNGSLYAAQTLGVLMLPLVGRELAHTRDALLAGGLLGALFLLNYQCAVLFPAFAAAVAIARGARASARPLGIAALASAAVVAPWLVRNAIVFGSPFLTTNSAFFLDKLGPVSVDFSPPRPRLVLPDATFGAVLRAVAGWTPPNFAVVLAAFSLVLPMLPFFAPGGFARMLARKPLARPSLAGAWCLAAFAALLAAAVLWPTPKARYFVPLVALAAGAAMVELAEKPRAAWAIATAAALVFLGIAIDAPRNAGFPWRESAFLLPTLAIPALALFAPVRKHLASAALVLIAAHGAFRVAIGLDREFACRVFGAPVEAAPSLGPPTATFYDLLAAPFVEGAELARLRELETAARLLADSKATVLVAPLEAARWWRGALVTPPARADGEGMRRAAEAFKADAVIVGPSFPDTAWLAPPKAKRLLHGPNVRAFRLAPP